MSRWLKSAERFLENLDQHSVSSKHREVGGGAGPEVLFDEEGNILLYQEESGETEATGADIVKLKRQLSELLHSENTLLGEVTSMKTLLRDAESRASTSMRQVEALRTEKDKEILSLQKQIKNAEGTISQMSSQTRQLESLNKNLRDEIYEYKARASALLEGRPQTDIEESKEEDSQELVDEGARLKTLLLKFEYVEGELEDAQRRNQFLEDHYKSEMKTLNDKLKESTQALSLEKSKNMTIRRENASNLAKLSVLERERSTFESKIREMEAERTSMPSPEIETPVPIQTTPKLPPGSRSTISQLSTALERRQAEIKSLREERASLRIQIERSTETAIKDGHGNSLTLNPYNSILFLAKLDQI